MTGAANALTIETPDSNLDIAFGGTAGACGETPAAPAGCRVTLVPESTR